MPQPSAPGVRTQTVTLDTLLNDLIWPQLFRAGQLALRPTRLMLALLYVLGTFLILSLSDRFDRDATRNVLGDFGSQAISSLHAIWSDILTWLSGTAFPPGSAQMSAGHELYALFIDFPAHALESRPVLLLIAVPLLLVWSAIMGGAIARTAAADYALNHAISWPQAIGFGLSRWLSLVGAILLPLVLIWCVAFVLAAVGLLFRAPGLNILAGFMWFGFLIGGLIASILIITYVLGQTMLIPAVACEGTDAIDALQHAYAFVFARPVRLILYTVLLLVQMLVLGFVVSVVVWLSISIAQAAGLAFSGVHGAAVLGPGNDPSALVVTQPGLKGVDASARWLVQLWTLLPLALLAAFFVSFYWSGCTLLYLAMRRICDGQDMRELWLPGMVPGTMAQSATAAPTSAPVGSGVIDETGPADAT